MKRSSIIAALALAYFACSAPAAAQNADFSSLNAMQVLTPIDQHAFVSEDEIYAGNASANAMAGLPSRPIVVLPIPLANGRQPPANPYGFHYPGSYIPRDTPLHRFNGYVVCNPPDTTGGTSGRRSREDTPAGRRMEKSSKSGLVKITTTRPLSAPDSLQPCPIYTINGQIQRDPGLMTSPSADRAERPFAPNKK